MYHQRVFKKSRVYFSIRGFTLLETLAAIAILAILAAFSMPLFAQMLAKQKIQTITADWRSAFYLAQREAIRLKHQVRLCGSSDGISCNKKNNWNQGWIVLDVSDNRLIQDFPLSDTEKLNIRFRVGNGVPLQFMNNGHLVSQFAGASFEVTHQQYKGISSTLKISRTGRIRQAIP